MPAWRSMKSAPTDENTEIRVKTKSGEVFEVWYYNCQWLREPGGNDPGDPNVTDCWTGPDGQIELEDAIGWLPAKT